MLTSVSNAVILANVPMPGGEERLSDYCKKNLERNLNDNMSSQSYRRSIKDASRVLNTRLVISRGILE